MKRRPLIGVTGADSVLPLAWWFIHMALARAGASALRMRPSHPGDLESLDGIVISGGDDIDTRLYLHDADEAAPADPERDQFEIGVLEQVLPTGLPVLGICRGAQLMNVVLGGSLHRDLRRMRQRTSNRRTPLARKTLLVEPRSSLERILGASHGRINSLHHQAIRDLGQELVVSGRDLDAIVQAVEGPGPRFLLGVQWHPEYLALHKSQQNIFRNLVAAAGGGEARTPK